MHCYVALSDVLINAYNKDMYLLLKKGRAGSGPAG